MPRRLDIGIASFRNPEKLRATLASIQNNSVTDWRCIIVHNPSEGEADEQARAVIIEAERNDPRFVALWGDKNEGYAGAVNEFFQESETEYLAYCDNDVEILTPGWDEALCSYLDRFHEIGIIFPNGGAYPINRGPYTEVLWAPGFCWILNCLCLAEVGGFDEELGHQEEADYAQRVRMAGWKCAAAPEVKVAHHATATSDPAAIERINRGVRAWVDKWNQHFNGKNFNYHSPNVTRFEDWPPQALYLEEYWKIHMPGLNDAPEVRTFAGREYDLIRVPRFKGFYTGRVI